MIFIVKNPKRDLVKTLSEIEQMTLDELIQEYQYPDNYDHHNPKSQTKGFPMDMAMFERDLSAVVSQLPPKLLVHLKALVGEHMQDIKRLAPQFMALLPHGKTLALEAAMGMVDVKEISDVLSRTFGVSVEL